MKLMLGLIVALGVGFTGLVNSNRIHVWPLQMQTLFNPPADVAPPVENAPAVPEPRPLAAAPAQHPAAEAQALAMQLYPGLALKDSPINRTFVGLYQEAKTSEPELLSRSDWPLQLAHRAMSVLGASPYAQPDSTPAIAGLAALLSTDSALDAPSKAVAHVRSGYSPYRYYYYTTSLSTDRSFAGGSRSAAPSSRASSPGTHCSAFSWSARSPYHSRLETYSRGGTTYFATSRGAMNPNPAQASSTAFSYRNPTTSASQASPVRCRVAAPVARVAAPVVSASSRTTGSSNSGTFRNR